jgi:thiol-disulfide isomerase/thioredoxin
MKRLLKSVLLILASYSVVAAQNETGTVKLEGQIVCCQDCWVKADRKVVAYGTAADLAQAELCIAKGDPTLVAVTNPQGVTEFYQLEKGKFKRPGKNWIEYVGKRVEITGSARSRKDAHFVRVDELKVLSSPNVAGVPQTEVIGTEAELALTDLSGVEQRLSAYRGRIVVLNFWATYCVPCRKEMPDLAAIQNQYAALGVQVIGASADTVADKAKVLRFIKETKLNFPVWLGASAADMTRFGLGSALPGTLIIGRDGKIVANIAGVIKPSELKSHLERLLAQTEKQTKDQLAGAGQKPAKASSVPS